MQVVWGDATRGAVLRAAGVDAPRAVAVCYADKESALQAVYTCRAEFPAVPIYACAADLRCGCERGGWGGWGGWGGAGEGGRGSRAAAQQGARRRGERRGACAGRGGVGRSGEEGLGGFGALEADGWGRAGPLGPAAHLTSHPAPGLTPPPLDPTPSHPWNSPPHPPATPPRHAAELEEAGASRVIIRSVEAGLALGGALLGEMGASEADLAYLKRGIEETIEARTQALSDWMHNNSEQVRGRGEGGGGEGGGGEAPRGGGGRRGGDRAREGGGGEGRGGEGRGGDGGKGWDGGVGMGWAG